MNRQSGTYPTLKQAFWLLLVFLAITIAVGIIVELTASLTLHGRETLAQKEEARFLAIGAVGYTLTLAWAIRKARAPLGEIFPFDHVSAGDIWPTVLSVFGLVIILEEAANLASRALPSWVPEMSNSLIGGFETLPWGVTALVVVIGPIAEELLFRGIVLRGFLSRYSTRKTVLTSALRVQKTQVAARIGA